MMMLRKPKESRMSEIVLLNAAGMEPKQVAYFAGIGAFTVTRTLNAVGLSFKRQKKAERLRPEIEKRLRAGLAQTVVARELGMHPSTICKMLARS
jgi:transposase